VTSSTSANEVVETLVYSVLLRAWMQNVEGSDVRTWIRHCKVLGHSWNDLCRNYTFIFMFLGRV